MDSGFDISSRESMWDLIWHIVPRVYVRLDLTYRPESLCETWFDISSRESMWVLIWQSYYIVVWRGDTVMFYTLTIICCCKPELTCFTLTETESAHLLATSDVPGLLYYYNIMLDRVIEHMYLCVVIMTTWWRFTRQFDVDQYINGTSLSNDTIEMCDIVTHVVPYWYWCVIVLHEHVTHRYICL
jgi:hypothetical protein